MENKQVSNKLNYTYGIILGVILSLVAFYSFKINNSLYSSNLTNGLLLTSVPVLGLFAILAAKKKVGFISFKEAMKNYTITIAVGLLISTLTNIVIFNFVDTDFYKTVDKIQIDSYNKQKEIGIIQMQNAGTPKETIEKVNKSIEDIIEKTKNENPYDLKNQILGYFSALATFLFFGLILSAITKKTNPSLR